MQARMIANANAPRTLNTGFRNQRGVFAGINALTADKEALAKAQTMIAQGVEPAKVWQETGWGRGADGKWRFEIDDSKIDLQDRHRNDVYFIEDAIGDNPITKAYPKIKDNYLNVGRLDRNIVGYDGMIDDAGDIALSARLTNDGNIKTNDLKSVLFHELQHSIQAKEGFAKGGNSEAFSFDDYKKLAGEVEARTTESRLKLNAQQRRENYPFDYRLWGYDVPSESQIVDFGSNKAMSQRPLTEFEQAHLIAQRNAALPVSQGGLGLAPDNTAMDRARALGFDVDNPVYHGTGADIDAFDLSRSGSASGAEQYGTGVYTTTNPTLASGYANSTVRNANVLPLVTRMANPISDETAKKLTKAQIKKIIEQSPDLDEQLWNYGDVGYEGKNKVLNDAVNSLYEYQGDKMLENLHPIANDFFKNNPVEFNNAAAKVLKKDGVVVSFPRYNEKFNIPWNANQVRSRFAAFDPMKKESSNLLATSAAIAPTATMAAYLYNQERNKGGKQ
jgi:hypothetical protein